MLTKIINVIIPFLSKRGLSWNINSYPGHFRNPENLKGFVSCWQQQNAIGVTVHSPIEIILLILWVSYIQCLVVHMNLGALGLPVLVWLCIHSSSVYSHLS